MAKSLNEVAFKSEIHLARIALDNACEAVADRAHERALVHLAAAQRAVAAAIVPAIRVATEGEGE